MNNFAESNEDIVEGMERAGAALSTTGTSWTEAFALFTAGQEVLQNAEKMGTSLRSVSLRLHGYSEDSEDDNLEEDSSLENISGELLDLTKTKEHQQGVSIYKEGSTTEFKDLTEYFQEVSAIWDEMTEKQQNDYLTKAFGKVQAQGGAAIIQNADAISEALEKMENAEGSADKEMGTIQDSITYKINEFQQTWVGIIQNILQRDDIGEIVEKATKASEDIGTVLENLAPILSVVMDILGNFLEDLAEMTKATNGWNVALVGLTAVASKLKVFDNIKEAFQYIQDKKSISAIQEVGKQLQNTKAQDLKTKVDNKAHELFEKHGAASYDMAAVENGAKDYKEIFANAEKEKADNIKSLTQTVAKSNEEELSSIVDNINSIDVDTSSLICSNITEELENMSKSMQEQVSTFTDSTSVIKRNTQSVYDNIMAMTDEQVAILTGTNATNENTVSVAKNIATMSDESVAILTETTAAETSTAANWTLTGAIKEQTVALIENAVAWIEANPLFAVAAAAIGIVAVAIWGAVKADEVYTEKVEETKEKTEELKEEVETITSNLEEMNEEIKENSERIDELKSKGSLTILEQSELDKLEKANKLLKYQKNLIEKNKKEKQQETAESVVDEYNAAYGSDSITELDSFSDVETALREEIVAYETDKEKVDEFIQNNPGYEYDPIQKIGYEKILEETDYEELREGLEQQLSDFTSYMQDYGYDDEHINSEFYKHLKTMSEMISESLFPEDTLTEKVSEQISSLKNVSKIVLTDLVKSNDLTVDSEEFSPFKTIANQLGISNDEVLTEIYSQLENSSEEIEEAVNTYKYNLTDIFTDEDNNAIDKFQTRMDTIKEALENLYTGGYTDENKDAVVDLIQSLMDSDTGFSILAEDVDMNTTSFAGLEEMLTTLADKSLDSLLSKIGDINDYDDPEAVRSWIDYFKELEKECTKVVDGLSDVNKAMTGLNNISSGIDELDSVYQTLKDENKLEFSDLISLQEIFGDLDSWDEAAVTLTNATSLTNESQQAIDNLLTDYLNSPEISDQLWDQVDEGNAEFITTWLKRLGTDVSEELKANGYVLSDAVDNEALKADARNFKEKIQNIFSETLDATDDIQIETKFNNLGENQLYKLATLYENNALTVDNLKDKKFKTLLLNAGVNSNSDAEIQTFIDEVSKQLSHYDGAYYDTEEVVSQEIMSALTNLYNQAGFLSYQNIRSDVNLQRLFNESGININSEKNLRRVINAFFTDNTTLVKDNPLIDLGSATITFDGFTLSDDAKSKFKELLNDKSLTVQQLKSGKYNDYLSEVGLSSKSSTEELEAFIEKIEEANDSILESAAAELEESEASEETQQYLAQLALTEAEINSTTIDSSDDIDNLIALAKKAGLATASLIALQQAKEDLEYVEAYENGEITYGDTTTNKAHYDAAKKNLANKDYDSILQEVYDSFEMKFSDDSFNFDGKDTSNDSDSDDDDDYIDWVQRRVDVLSADIDELASKVENALTVKDKNTFLDQEIEKANELKDTYEGAISVYWTRFQKVAKDKGVNANYLYKIMNGDMSIEDFTGDTRSKYKEAIESAQEWFDLYNEEDKNIIDEEQTILDLEQQQLDTISDQAETRRSQIDDNNSLIEAKQGNAKNVKEEIKLINKLSANSTKNVKTYKDEVDDDNDELRKDTRKLNKILPDSASDGLTDKDIDKIKARIKNGKKIPKKIIDKVTDSDLRVKMTTYNQDVAELQADELDYNIAKEEDETTQYENKIQKKEERRTRKQNLNDRRQDKVDKISERIENGNATEEDFTKYQSIIEKQKVTQSEIIALDEKELALAEEKFGKNSDEYKEIYERLKDDTDQLKEYNKEMLEIPIKKLQQLNEELEEANDIYSKATSYVNYYVGEQIDQTEKYYDALIDHIQDQLDLLQEVNEERELSIALQKAEFNLNRAMNQKTNLTLTKDGWVYEADQNAIKEAQEEVDSANYDLTTHRLQDAIDELKEQKKDALDKLNDWLDKFSDACDVFENSQNLKAFEQIFGTSDLSKLGIDKTWISSVFEPYSTNLLSQTDATEELTERGEDIVEAYEDGTITYDEAVEQLSELNVNGYKLDQKTLNTLIETIEKAGVNLSTETTLGDDSGTKTTTTEESTEAKAAKKSVQNAVNSYLYTVKNAYGEDSDQYRDASSQFSDSSSSYYYDISDFIDYMKENYGNDSTEYHMAYEMLKTAAKRSNDYDLANASDTGVASTTKASYDSTVISTMSDSIKTLVNKVASDNSDSVTGTIVTSNGKITTAVDVGTGKVDYDAKLLYQQATADASTTAEFREGLDEFLTGSGKKGTTLSGYFNEETDTLVVSNTTQTSAINTNTSAVVSNLIKSTNSIYSILNNYFNSLDDDDDDSSSGSSKKIKSNAKGTSNAQAGKSLVAEDGAELIWHKSAGTAELVSDTSVVDLDHGDVVYTASQTEDILGRNGATYSPISVNSLGQMGGSSITLPSHATGLNNYGSNLKLSVPSVSNSAFGGTTTLHVDNISLPNVKTQDDAHLIVEALCNLTNETLVTKYRK